MQFLKEPLSPEKQQLLIRWLSQPERENVTRLVKALIASFQVESTRLGTTAERTALGNVLAPKLESSQRTALVNAAEWEMFLVKFEELATMVAENKSFTGTIIY